MSDEAWLSRWQDGRIGFHEAATNQHLLTHWPALTQVSSAGVFVPLCGKSLDMLWLAARHTEVVGVELSPIAVRDFFAEAGLSPIVTEHGDLACWQAQNLYIYVGDFFVLSAQHLRGARFVYDRASLIALPESIRPKYQRHLLELMPSDVLGLTVTVDYPQSEMSGPPFAVSDAEIRELAGACNMSIEAIAEHDVLAGAPKFRERGVTRMVERVYRWQRDSEKAS
ncbi:MAG: thiopurine S-methyltransferase [Pseudomonadota bacterium]